MSTGSARKCMNVGGEFYSCRQSEEINEASKSNAARKTFHHRGETTTDMVDDLLVHSHLILNMCVCVCCLSYVFYIIYMLRFIIMMMSVRCVRTEASWSVVTAVLELFTWPAWTLHSNPYQGIHLSVCVILSVYTVGSWGALTARFVRW